MRRVFLLAMHIATVEADSRRLAEHESGVLLGELEAAVTSTTDAISTMPAPAAAGLPCSTALDCALNGACVAGRCVCDLPWRNFNATAGACTMLDMRPAPTTACGPGCVYHGNTSAATGQAAAGNSSSWGARVLPLPAVAGGAGGGYVMAVAEAAYGCDFLGTWRSNSQTAIAVAVTPVGPFRKLGVAVRLASTADLVSALVGFGLGFSAAVPAICGRASPVPHMAPL